MTHPKLRDIRNMDNQTKMAPVSNQGATIASGTLRIRCSDNPLPTALIGLFFCHLAIVISRK